MINLEGKYVYPGFIDAHCHFYGYAQNLQWIDLTVTNSFGEIIDLLKEYHKKKKEEENTAKLVETGKKKRIQQRIKYS